MRTVLPAWGQRLVIEPLDGGNRNTVLELRRGQGAAGRPPVSAPARQP